MDMIPITCMYCVGAGVCFYQRESLPGYSAIFRHANDELNYCYYLIPCGKDGMCGNVTVRVAAPTPRPAAALFYPCSWRLCSHVLQGLPKTDAFADPVYVFS